MLFRINRLIDGLQTFRERLDAIHQIDVGFTRKAEEASDRGGVRFELFRDWIGARIKVALSTLDSVGSDDGYIVAYATRKRPDLVSLQE